MSLTAAPVPTHAPARAPVRRTGAAALAAALAAAAPQLWAPLVEYRDGQPLDPPPRPDDAAAVARSRPARRARRRPGLAALLAARARAPPLHDHGTSAGRVRRRAGRAHRAGGRRRPRDGVQRGDRRPHRGPGAALRPALRAPGDQHAAPSRRSACTSTRPRCAWMNTYRVDGRRAGPHRHRAGRGGLVSATHADPPAGGARTHRRTARRGALPDRAGRARRRRPPASPPGRCWSTSGPPPSGRARARCPAPWSSSATCWSGGSTRPATPGCPRRPATTSR